jgi:hypothetical protein
VYQTEFLVSMLNGKPETVQAVIPNNVSPDANLVVGTTIELIGGDVQVESIAVAVSGMTL